MKDKRTLVEIMTEAIDKIRQESVELPNVSESDKVYYDLEVMRELQKQNPHCRIITNSGGEVHISHWIAMLENIKGVHSDEH